jgi:hypothetical protein
MILKTITNSDRRKAELITDKEQIATYWHTVQQASKRLYHKYCTWPIKILRR